MTGKTRTSRVRSAHADVIENSNPFDRELPGIVPAPTQRETKPRGTNDNAAIEEPLVLPRSNGGDLE